MAKSPIPLWLLPGALTVLLLAPSATAQERAVKVGIFKAGLGGKSTLAALATVDGIEAARLDQLTVDQVLGYDVVFVGACSLDQPEQVRALKVFVSCGGGLILNHSSCGRRRPETLFPAIAKRVIDRREDTVLVVRDAAHALAAGLPGEFEHAYHDHLFLEPGPDGHTVLADRAGAAVTVVGESGHGRVVFNGSIPGYWYDAATYWQGERELSEGERVLVLNAVRWAGAPALTLVAAEELARRRQRIETELKLADMVDMLPSSDWFGDEMLLGSYLPMQPVTELGGRFFITYDRMCWRGYGLRKRLDEAGMDSFRNRLRIDVNRLRCLGVTDILLWTDVHGEEVEHATDVPDSKRAYASVDPLAELIKAATPAGLHVWAAWHSCSRSKAFAETYCARDGDGNFYKYGGRDFCEDLLGEAYRERCHRLLDEYAEKYKPLGNFEGLACYDELWFLYADFHGDDLVTFGQFCQERFGVSLPADMGARLARGRRWLDADDVWRRRYILFKQWVMTEFWRDLVEYSHRQGLQVGIELRSTSEFSSGWCWGMDSVALARLGADFYNTSPNETPANSYPNTLRWAHCYSSWGYYNTHCLRGWSPGGIYFTFNQLWRLLMYGSNPDLPRELGRHIYNQRQWSNADGLAAVAFLQNQNALQMLLADPRPEVNRAQALFNALQRSQDAEMIYTQAHERFGQYPVLVATPYSVRGLSESLLERLRQFVQGGGIVVSVHADWSVAKADLTEERDVSGEMLGCTYGESLSGQEDAVRYGAARIPVGSKTPRRRVTVQPGTQVLATFGDGSPAVTERAYGKGKVLGIHFDAGAELEGAESDAVGAFFRQLLREMSTPAVRAEGEGFQLVSAVRKGNWIAVALSPDKAPCKLQLFVDPQALGIEKDRFRVLMYGKRMEISRPGDLWGESGFWRADELKQGFAVTIVADNDRVMPLPETFDLGAFEGKGKRATSNAEYLDRITRSWWDSASRGTKKRDYAHEIVILAPGDEPVMP